MYEALKEGNDGDVGGSLKGLVNVRDVRSVIRTAPAGEASGDGRYIPYHSSNPKQRPPKRRPLLWMLPDARSTWAQPPGDGNDPMNICHFRSGPGRHASQDPGAPVS